MKLKLKLSLDYNSLRHQIHQYSQIRHDRGETKQQYNTIMNDLKFESTETQKI